MGNVPQGTCSNWIECLGLLEDQHTSFHCWQNLQENGFVCLHLVLRQRELLVLEVLLSPTKQTKLQPEKVEKLLYIQQNYVKVKIKKWLLTSAEEQADEAAAVEGPASPSPAASRTSTPNVVDLTVEDNY